MHGVSVGAQVLDVPGAGDSSQEAAIGDRGEDLAVFDHEDVGCSGLGNVAHHIKRYGVVEPFCTGFQQHPRIVGIEAPGLCVHNGAVQRGAAELGGGQAGRGLRWGHRDLFQRDGKTCAVFARGHTHMSTINGPVHRTDIDGGIFRKQRQAFLHDLDHLFGRHGRRDHQRLGRAVGARAVCV